MMQRLTDATSAKKPWLSKGGRPSWKKQKVLP